MGYIRNHAIVVTGTYGDFIERAHAEATKIFPWVSAISPPLVNGSQSFFIPPDGSKERWPESDEGDAQREEFKEFLRAQLYNDASSPLAWCEVKYGGDDYASEVIAHSHEELAKRHQLWREKQLRPST